MASDEVERGFYFLVRSRLNRLLLTVRASDVSSVGAPVVTWPEEREPKRLQQTQIWYYDRITQTLRGKESDLCLDISDGAARVAPFNPRLQTQVMRVTQCQIICSTSDREEQVLEVEKSNLMPGTKAVPFVNMELPNQQWTFTYQPAMFFKLRSGMNDKVLDVFKEEKKAGAKVTVWADKEVQSANQLWYEDSQGRVRAKLNNFVLDSSDGHFKLQPLEEGQENQQWVISDGCIRHISPHIGQVATVKDKGPFDGVRLVTMEYDQNNLAQVWKKEFII